MEMNRLERVNIQMNARPLPLSFFPLPIIHATLPVFFLSFLFQFIPVLTALIICATYGTIASACLNVVGYGGLGQWTTARAFKYTMLLFTGVWFEIEDPDGLLQGETWEKLSFPDMTKEETVETCRRIFERHLGGHDLMSNAAHLRGSAVWMQFPRVICENWYHENVVLMGDAAATGHFSIGSGTRLAFDSAIALAEYLHSEPDMQAAFQRYQEERRVEVLRLQSAARNSLEWFEQVERYLHLDPVQFAYSLLTRSQRISHENLRLRDPEWLAGAEEWFQTRTGGKPGSRPMFAPFRLRNMELKNRIVMSPMAQYKAVDGCPTDWHLIHYAERAKGGAAMIYTEMTCVSAEGRITPGCPGLYAPEHEAAWKRLADFIHAETSCKLCIQIGHSGRKGSTCVPWVGGIDAPLREGNWDLMAASPLPYKPGSAAPREMDRADMDMVRDQFVASTEMAARAGADMVEMHAAHGYLLATFISPVTNRRTDEYGGSLENRMRYPLEVFDAASIEAALQIAAQEQVLWASERIASQCPAWISK